LRGTIGLEDAKKRVMATRVSGTVIKAEGQRAGTANRGMMIIVGLGLMRDSVIGTGRDLQVATPTATVSGIAIGKGKEDNLLALGERVKLQSFWWLKLKYVNFDFDYQEWRRSPLTCLNSIF